MKLKNLLKTAEKEIQIDKINVAVKEIKECILTIEELKKALSTAETKLSSLLEKDLDDVEADVWK